MALQQLSYQEANKFFFEFRFALIIIGAARYFLIFGNNGVFVALDYDVKVGHTLKPPKSENPRRFASLFCLPCGAI